MHSDRDHRDLSLRGGPVMTTERAASAVIYGAEVIYGDVRDRREHRLREAARGVCGARSSMAAPATENE
jgi:hypothetical protein